MEEKNINEMLGIDGDKKAYRKRTLIVDIISNITNIEYLGDILRLSVSALCKQEYRDAKGTFIPENKTNAHDSEKEIPEDG